MEGNRKRGNPTEEHYKKTLNNCERRKERAEKAF